MDRIVADLKRHQRDIQEAIQNSAVNRCEANTFQRLLQSLISDVFESFMNLRPDFVSHIEYRKACLGQIKPESREPGQTVDISQWRADHARRGKMLTEVSCLEASVLGYLQIVRGYSDHLFAGFLPLQKIERRSRRSERRRHL